MKKSFYFFTLLLASCLLNAQTLTQAYHEPVITEVDRNYKLDTTAYTTGLPLAITGTNVVWDFSLLTGMFPVINDTIITPTAAVSGTAYPSATYCQKRNDIFTFYKSESNPSQTELVGVYSPTLSFTFTNTAIIATYPVAYGYSKTDGVSGSFKFGTNTGACNGSITVVADGMGTVKFPFGATFNNVLRLKSVQELTVSSGLFPLGTINQYFYSYYAPGKKYPILTVQYNKYQFLAGTPTITTLAAGNGDYFNVAGIGEELNKKSAVNLSPNPFQDHLTIGTAASDQILEVRLYNLTGELLLSSKNKTLLDTEKLPPGIYLAELASSNGITFQKLIKH
jgi:hypothetical protein